MAYGQRAHGGNFFLLLFLLIGLLAGSCGEDLKAAGLTAENKKLKMEAARLRVQLSGVHSQVAELSLKLSTLQEENNALQKEIQTLKKGRR